MSESPKISLTVDEALKILRAYSCLEIKTPESETEKEQLRQALLLITKLSDWQNLGICADDSNQGYATLSIYLKALGYQHNFDRDSMSNSDRPVYLKFNSQRMSHLLSPYDGEYRGVLVSCQSEDDSIAGTYGHFPLDL